MFSAGGLLYATSHPTLSTTCPFYLSDARFSAVLTLANTMPATPGLSPVSLQSPRVWRQNFPPRLHLAPVPFRLSSGTSLGGYVYMPAAKHLLGRCPFFAWPSESSSLDPCRPALWVSLFGVWQTEKRADSRAFTPPLFRHSVMERDVIHFLVCLLSFLKKNILFNL